MASPALNRLIAKLFVRPPSRRDRRAARLGVERLEARDVPAVTFAIEKLSDATEGGAAGQFRVTATGDASDFTNAVYAYWTATGGTASPTNDYTTTPGTGTYLIFNASGATATVTITAVDDSDTEGDETVGLTVQRYQMYPMGPQYTGSLTIHDNDAPSPPPPSPPPPSPPPPPPPLPVVSVTRVNDAVEGGQLGYFRFARSGPTTDTLAANYIVRTIGPGYADPGDDYTTLSELVTFLPGMATVDVAVEAHPDGWAESPETVDVLVMPGAGYVESEANALVWIWDDVSLLPPEVSVSGAADAVEGGANGILRFSRTGSTDDALVVTYTLATGTDEATPGSDYTILSGEVTIPIGKSSVDVTVTAVDDEVDEPTERVTATVQAPPGYVVGASGTGVVRIADTDTFSGMIGGFVWDDTSEDGIRDPLEVGRADQVVTLLNSEGSVLFVGLTASDGTYAFGGLPEGTYQVQFSQPLLEKFTLKDQGESDAADSDADLITGATDPIELNTLLEEYLLATAGLVQQRPAEGGPRVVIVDKDGNEVSALKVAKWHAAFQGPQDKNLPDAIPELKPADTDGSQTGYDFIDLDDDRFGVRVYDPVLYNKTMPEVTDVMVTIQTTNQKGYEKYNDLPTTLALKKMTGGLAAKFSGWYMSDSQMLVSNDVDDKYLGGVLGTSNTIGPDESGPDPKRVNKKVGLDFPITDRTHKIALGGTVRVDYTPGVFDTASVDPRGRVRLHTTILNTTNGNPAPATTPAVTIDAVKADISSAREIFAQIALAVDFDEPVVRDQPPGVNLAVNGLTNIVGEGADAKYAAEFMSLITHQPFKKVIGENETPVIELYYVDTLTNGDVGHATLTLGNTGVPPYCIVIASDRLYMTLAHEIAHILLNDPKHVGGSSPTAIQSTHLLVDGDSVRDKGDVFDSRRLTSTNDLMVHGMFKSRVVNRV